MKTKGMTAVSLRFALGFLVVVLFALIGVGFYLAQNYLISYAADVSQTVAKSQSGGTDLKSLQNLQSQLDELQGAAIKASNLSISKSLYETQTINDLNTYASRSGIKILNYAFSTGTATARTTTRTTASATGSSVTIKIESPISYVKLINFMSFIESNLPKMQINSLTISRGSGLSADTVTVSDIVVDIQTK